MVPDVLKEAVAVADGRARDEYERRLERAAELRAFGTPQGAGAEDQETREKRRKIDNAARADYLVRDAIARGGFENLKYAGKPIPGLGDRYDPDWWIKGLIQRENLTGIGPQAILLRKEDAGLDDLLDTLYTEKQVRETIEDFNARVIEARRQLLGGPPVITKTRDVDGEVARWQERRAPRTAAAPADPEPEPRRPWWRRLWGGTR
jgi:hypothetical protein